MCTRKGFYNYLQQWKRTIFLMHGLLVLGVSSLTHADPISKHTYSTKEMGSCIIAELRSIVESSRNFGIELKQSPATRLFVRRAKTEEVVRLNELLFTLQTHISDQTFKVPGDLTRLGVYNVQHPIWPILPEYRLAGPAQLAFDWFVVWPVLTITAKGVLNPVLVSIQNRIATLSDDDKKNLANDIATDYRYKDIKLAKQQGKLSQNSAIQAASDRTTAYNTYITKASTSNVDVVTFSTEFLTHPKVRPLFDVAEPFLQYSSSANGLQLKIENPHSSSYVKMKATTHLAQSAQLEKVLTIANNEIFEITRLPSWISSLPTDSEEKKTYDLIMSNHYEQKLISLNKSGKIGNHLFLYLVSQDIFNRAHLQIEELLGYSAASENWNGRSASEVLEDLRRQQLVEMKIAL